MFRCKRDLPGHPVAARAIHDGRLAARRGAEHGEVSLKPRQVRLTRACCQVGRERQDHLVALGDARAAEAGVEALCQERQRRC
jgi:hypothetical protein